MNGTTTASPAPVVARGPGRAGLFLLGPALVASIVFITLAALPYFTVTEERFGPFWPNRGWLLLHIAGGTFALLTGPVQLWFGLSDRRMGLHRRLGTAYLIAVAVSALTALYLAAVNEIGWVYGAGLTGLSAAWILTTGLAFVAIRRSLLDQHKEWMIRSYVVTFAFVGIRVVISLLQMTGIGTDGEQATFAVWFCWAVPLVFTEGILQGRNILVLS